MDIEIRKAADTDFDFFYSIKCEEDNMYWSGHSLRPQYDALYTFFASQIRQDVFSQRTIFIVEEKHSGQSVGYLYLDPTGTDTAEISVAIAKPFSGRGFGRQAVCALCKYTWDYGFKHISAMIREDNLRSQNMFTHAGFQRTNSYVHQFIQNLNKEVKMIKFEKRSRTMELGSEFDMDLHECILSSNGFSQYIGNMNNCLFDSGRSALKAVAHVIGNGYILLPEYICGSVIKCLPADQVVFYRLKENLQIDTDDLCSKISNKTTVVYLMHYFGNLQPENILSLLRDEKEKFGFTIIEDTTHSIFTKTQTVGDYCVASLRKWFPLPNGGVLYASVPLNTFDEIPRSADNSKAYAMMLKHLHLSGRLDCNPEYRALFAACEEKLDNQKEIKRISDLSELLLNCNDVDDMAKRRAFNLNYLKDRLSSLGIRQLCDFADGDCPFTLPILVPKRDAFRSHLMENRIYCAVHWPFDGLAQEHRPLAVFLSSTMLSLPIDQRYGEKEMEYLATVIGAYKGRLQL